MTELTDTHETIPENDAKYTVVARRYRPKTFDELVGQDTVAQALLRAIETHRVGHAYLFTGARGVGKTSTARIFAKALNASSDGSGRFDPDSEIARAIDSGEDMDVIEIDGASNRGIDEIRQLRANASVRPSRSRFKIYIIDEVHMLTTQAFNALLKTLEEPPAHVKFIFCTTDPEKIPITVLSRCQRFDFPPVHSEQILQRLRFICDSEGTEADDDALKLIARRAAGSMRDSQSLLEQLLSFGGDRITVDDVHSMLGTADETRLACFAKCLMDRDAAGALRELDLAVGAGVDPGQLAEQLLGYLRDMMALTVGGTVDLIRTANPNSADSLRQSGQAWGTMTLLSALQLLDEAIVRMKHSVQARILLEVALVQICSLQDLQTIADVVRGLATGLQPPAPGSRTANAPSLPNGPATPNSSAVSVGHAASTGTASAGTPQPKGTSASTTSVATQGPSASASQTHIASSQPPTPASVTPTPQPQGTSTASEGVKHASVPSTSDSATRISEPSPKAPPATSDEAKKKEAELSRTVSADADPMRPPSAATHTAASSTSSPQVSSDAPLAIFQKAIGGASGIIQQASTMALEVQAIGPGRWRVHLAREAKFAVEWFKKPENESVARDAVQAVVGEPIAFDWVVTDRPLPPEAKQREGRAAAVPNEPARSGVPQNQRIREMMTHPLVKRFLDVFEGHVVRVDAPVAATPAPPKLATPDPTASDTASAPEALSETE